MGIILDSINDAIRDQFTTPRMVAMVVIHKLSQQGIELPSNSLDILSQCFAPQLETSSVISSLDFPDDWLEQNVSEADREQISNMTLDLNDESFLTNRVSNSIEHATRSAVESASNIVYDYYVTHAKQALVLEHDQAQSFRKYVNQIWGGALDKLEVIIGISSTEGMAYNKHHRAKAATAQDYVFEALTRLHARGMQIGHGVLALLQNGLADDAHARWRTLYEITVIASFIRQHGNSVAEAYLLHSTIREYKELCFDRKSYAMMGYNAPSDQNIKKLKQAYDDLVHRFGKGFTQDYGWALTALKGKPVNFKSIEQAAKMDQFRLLYQIASENVHGGARGITAALGLPPDRDVLLAGLSIFGIGEPGRNSAHALLVLTMALLVAIPDSPAVTWNADNLAIIKALRKLQIEAHNAFFDAESKLLHDFEEADATRKSQTPKQ